MSKIFDLSWKKDSFLAKLQLLWLAQGKFTSVTATKFTDDWRAGYVQLASTHYSIAGTGAAKWRQASRPHVLMPFRLWFWLVAWLPLTAFCYWRMLPLVRKAEKLGGWEAMTANQIDVCQSILRRRGKFGEAGVYILAAFDGVKEVSPHTMGLLMMGLVECELEGSDEIMFGVFITDHFRRAICAAEESEATEPAQAVRIYRGCAKLLKLAKKKGINLSEDVSLTAEELLTKAHELAWEHGSKDQLAKLA